MNNMSNHYGSLPSTSARDHDGEDDGSLLSSSNAGARRIARTKSAALGKGLSAALAVIGMLCVGFATYGCGGGSSTQVTPSLGQPINPSSPCDDDPNSLNSCAAFYTRQSALSVKASTCPAGMREEILPPSWWSKCQNQQGACPSGCGTCKPPDQQVGGGCFCAGNSGIMCTVECGYPGQKDDSKTCGSVPCREDDPEAAGCVPLDDNCE